MKTDKRTWQNSFKKRIAQNKSTNFYVNLIFNCAFKNSSASRSVMSNSLRPFLWRFHYVCMTGWIVGHWWFTYTPALFPSPKAGSRESSSPLITGCFPLETVPNLQCSQKSPQHKHRGFLQRTRCFSHLHHYQAISAPGHKKHKSKCNQRCSHSSFH